jgi:hypothetical protein
MISIVIELRVVFLARDFRKVFIGKMESGLDLKQWAGFR